MPNGLWPSLHMTGLAANLPSTLSEFPANTGCFYYATDTRVLYMWDPNTATWSSTTTPPQLVVAAGNTIGSSTAITANLAIVTAYSTSSQNGVKLPAAATGREVTVVNKTGGTIKIYPTAHQFINALASNVADTVLAIKKSNTYIGTDASHWVCQRGS